MISVSDLPAVNAGLNATSAALLCCGYYFVRRKQVTAHLGCMIAAFVVSILFLACYLTYHFQHGATRFTGQGWVRPLYFAILISHTVLATAVVPMVLVTLYRAARGQFEQHRRIARWTWPVWLYVSITGVAVYWMLHRLFPAPG